ncbi:uncharacterized protein B0I36DRAFT_378638 [Microdochium trichocladiopsis]|uniref:Transcription factor domain-containing protein n=1 Tax=Microdochium trichocladiopsis TaxID=1682393 RepID=A0A9P9BKC4_9PEZI|nr:uncharacterized protein B0I36DRAFT_378638 [Microdochium trichocladiopsis]KAH7009268.1 hypothetical protein B0I36DRAFT_378638 [Microdochium trichocladiopsis]
MSHGKIDILDLSIADWKAISQQWAEKAGGQALGRADRPCLEVVQACQVLAMFWFAKGETKRTNVHTAIAYRASRLLHLDDASKTAWSAHKELGLGCFWACWLTRCTSQENSRFPGDCWADVAGRPLPVGADDVAANSRALYLDEKGGIIYPDRESAVGFSSVLIVVQGLWWEVQNFGRSIYGSRGTPADWTLQYCILDKKLEDLNLQLPGWDWGSASRGTTSPSAEEPSRMFSLGYLYELCNLYLHSSVVPVFSCLGQTRILSQPMLQLAAERAWEHSLKLTTMTEQYLARQSPISKLWPMIGYGAYVCAAVQLRRCLALRLLDEQRLGRARVHLQFTGGLMRYWTTLRPLHEDMERQFAQTQVLSHTLQATAPASVPVRAGDGQSPFDTRDPAFSTELTSSIQTYVADEDVVESSRAASEPRGEYSEMVTPRELPQRIAGPGDPPWAGAQAQPPPAQVWWNQDSGSLGEAFGSGSFWPEDLGFLMDIA